MWYQNDELFREGSRKKIVNYIPDRRITKWYEKGLKLRNEIEISVLYNSSQNNPIMMLIK